MVIPENVTVHCAWCTSPPLKYPAASLALAYLELIRNHTPQSLIVHKPNK